MIVYMQLIDIAEDRSKFERLYEQYKHEEVDDGFPIYFFHFALFFND